MTAKPTAPIPSLIPSVTVMDDLQVHLSFHPELGLVHTRISGCPRSRILREALTMGARVLQAERANRWLFDERGCLAIRDTDAAWVDTRWAPGVIQSGLRYLAIVQPDPSNEPLTLHRFAEEYALLDVRLAQFRALEPALMWMGSDGDVHTVQQFRGPNIEL